jgi:hypothetical protein
VAAAPYERRDPRPMVQHHSKAGVAPIIRARIGFEHMLPEHVADHCLANLLKLAMGWDSIGDILMRSISASLPLRGHMLPRRASARTNSSVPSALAWRSGLRTTSLAHANLSPPQAESVARKIDFGDKRQDRLRR